MDIPYSGETYSCSCGAEIEDDYRALKKRKFVCEHCGRQITISLDCGNSNHTDFWRIPASKVLKGDMVILDHPRRDLVHEVLDTRERKVERALHLAGHGSYVVLKESLIKIFPRAEP